MNIFRERSFFSLHQPRAIPVCGLSFFASFPARLPTNACKLHIHCLVRSLNNEDRRQSVNRLRGKQSSIHCAESCLCILGQSVTFHLKTTRIGKHRDRLSEISAGFDFFPLPLPFVIDIEATNLPKSSLSGRKMEKLSLLATE